MAIETNADVARRARGLVAEKNAKKAALAAELNLSRMALWRRLSGETPFTAAELIGMARVIGVPVSAFYAESSEETVAVAS